MYVHSLYNIINEASLSIKSGEWSLTFEIARETKLFSTQFYVDDSDNKNVTACIDSAINCTFKCYTIDNIDYINILNIRNIEHWRGI